MSFTLLLYISSYMFPFLSLWYDAPQMSVAHRASFPEPLFLLSPKSLAEQKKWRPSFSVHVANEYSVPYRPYSRACFVLLLLNRTSWCLGLKVACDLVVLLRNGQWEKLVKTQQNENLLKPARKKKRSHLCLASCLTERGSCLLPAGGLCFI